MLIILKANFITYLTCGKEKTDNLFLSLQLVTTRSLTFNSSQSKHTVGAQKWLESTQKKTPAWQVLLWPKNKCVCLNLYQLVSVRSMLMMVAHPCQNNTTIDTVLNMVLKI